jgi:hypothetical protein
MATLIDTLKPLINTSNYADFVDLMKWAKHRYDPKVIEKRRRINEAVKKFYQENPEYRERQRKQKAIRYYEKRAETLNTDDDTPKTP